MKLFRILLFIVFLNFFIGCCGNIKKIHKPIIGQIPNTSYFITLEYFFEGNEESFAIITGSGVSVSNPQEDKSLVMTAAHVCVGDPAIAFMTPEISIHSVDGIKTDAYILALDLQNDLCVLGIDANLPVTKIAKEPPNLLDKVYYVGYPGGLYYEGVLHKLEGYYSGVEPFGGDIWSFPATNGASGSPVYNKNSELIGIISSVHMDFPHVVMGANIVAINSLLENILQP